MVKPGVGNGLSAVNQIVDVVQRVEISDGGDAVFPEEPGVGLNHVERLRFEPDDIDTSRQGLQIGIGSGSRTKSIHHGEGVFPAVEIK